MKISEDEWKKYRDIAPETIDDERLKKLISNNEGDPSLIAAAIENLWQDQPQVGSSAWTSTSKPKKEVGRVSQSHQKITKGSGGRDKTNRFSSSVVSDADVAGRRQAPVSYTKTPSFLEKENTRVLKPVNLNSIGVTTPPNHTAWKDSTNFAQKLKEQLTAPPVIAPKIDQQFSVEAETSEAVQSDGKLEKQNVVATPEENVENLESSDGINHFEEEAESFETSGSDAIDNNVIEPVESFIAEVEIEIDDDVPEEVENGSPDDNILDLQNYENLSGDISSQSVEFSEQHTDISPPQYLNLGKWEKPVESIEIGGFQFGSFGSEGTLPLSTVTTNTTWSDIQPTEQANSIHTTINNAQSWSSNISNNAAELATPSSTISPSDLSSLFPIQTQNPVVSDSVGQMHTSSRFDQQKHALPPGLDTHSQMKNLNISSQQMNKNLVSVNQPRKQDLAQQPMQYPNPNQFQQYQQQQQLQQVGSSLLSSNRGQGPNISSGQSQQQLPPFYNPGFDLPSGGPQYSQNPYNASTTPSTSNVLPTAVNVPSTISSPSTVQPSAAATVPQQQQQQPQQQAFTPPPGMTSAYGYYPYGYPNQPYYYSQPNVPPNYYGQNRNVYQNPRSSYQTDPYSSNGSMYSNDMYPSGQQQQQQQQPQQQFSDSSNTYGSMQVPQQHPSLSQQQAAASLSSVNSAALSMANKQKTGTLPIANQRQHSAQQQDIPSQHTSYAYNPYAPPVRGNDASWPYQQQQQQPQQQNNSQGWGAQMVSFPQSSQVGSSTNPATQNASFSPPVQQPGLATAQPQNPREMNQRPNPTPAVGYNSNVGGGGSFNPRGSAPTW